MLKTPFRVSNNGVLLSVFVPASIFCSVVIIVIGVGVTNPMAWLGRPEAISDIIKLLKNNSEVDIGYVLESEYKIAKTETCLIGDKTKSQVTVTSGDFLCCCCPLWH